MRKTKIIFITLAVVIGVAALVRFDYYVWRLKHPSAPFWTYIVK